MDSYIDESLQASLADMTTEELASMCGRMSSSIANLKAFQDEELAVGETLKLEQQHLRITLENLHGALQQAQGSANGVSLESTLLTARNAALPYVRAAGQFLKGEQDTVLVNEHIGELLLNHSLGRVGQFAREWAASFAPGLSGTIDPRQWTSWATDDVEPTVSRQDINSPKPTGDGWYDISTPPAVPSSPVQKPVNPQLVPIIEGTVVLRSGTKTVSARQRTLKVLATESCEDAATRFCVENTLEKKYAEELACRLNEIENSTDSFPLTDVLIELKI